MITEEILQKLAILLCRLVGILRLDPKCQWTSKFESDLERCQNLIKDGYRASDLTDLSTSITYVFQGMGSFNDYAPATYNPANGRYSAIPGSEDFETITKEVFDLATQLKR